MATRRSFLCVDLAWEMARKGLLGFLCDLWREHGDLARLRFGSGNLFLVTHPRHVQLVGQNRDGHYDKVASYESIRRLLLGKGLVASSGEEWRERRRLAAPRFASREMRAHFGVLLEAIRAQALRWRWLAADRRPVEMNEEMSHLAGRIILRFLVSATPGEPIEELERAVGTMLRFAAFRSLLPLPFTAVVPGRAGREFRRARRIVDAHVSRLIQARRAAAPGTAPRDFLSFLLETSSDEVVLDEIKTFFIAGYETTARTMAFCWHFLATHPTAAGRLHDEVSAVLGEEDPSFDALKELRYARAVLQETMRLCPPVPLYARDVVTPHQIDGMDIPARARMVVLPYVTHRHPDFWKDPELFDPDRWLDPGAVPETPGAYHPFAFGERACIGSQLAFTEGLAVLSVLARDFAPAHADPAYTLTTRYMGTLGAVGGIPMTIRSRAA